MKTVNATLVPMSAAETLPGATTQTLIDLPESSTIGPVFAVYAEPAANAVAEHLTMSL